MIPSSDIILGLTADDVENIAYMLHAWKSSATGVWNGGGTASFEADEDTGKTLDKIFDALKRLDRKPTCTVKCIRVNGIEFENVPDVLTYEDVVRMAGFESGSAPRVTCDYTSLPDHDNILLPGMNVRTAWGSIFKVKL